MTTVDFVNKSGAVQSIINITYPVDLKPGADDLIKASVANTILGGFFQSRLNDNLRETKAYTYGARSRLSYDENVGYFLASASVYFLTQNAHIVVIGNQDEVAEKLGRFSADGKVHYYDVYGNKVEMNKNTVPDGLTAQTVVNEYIKAAGGKDKLMKVNEVYSMSSASMQGMTLSMENYQMGNEKFANKVTMMGNVVQSVTFDGAKGKMGGMQGEKMIEGEEATAMKGNALIFPELHYDRLDYEL